MTNADRIRAMSDEELTAFLFQSFGCSNCKIHGPNCSIDCEKWCLDWLRKEDAGC